jgi:hypothetical protein
MKKNVKVIGEGPRPSIFMPSYEISLEVKGLFKKLPLATLYGVAFRSATLLGERSIELMSSTPLSIGTDYLNMALANELMFADLKQDRTDLFQFCDDRITHVTTGASFWSEVAKCKNWAAVSTAMLEIEASQLVGKDSSKIFIAPFAWHRSLLRLPSTLYA